MISLFRAAAGVVALSVVACADSKPAGSDTSRPAYQNTGEAERVDMIRIDSMAAKPVPSTVPNRKTLPAPEAVPSRTPPVIGETRRDAPVARDPMPPLRGETSKSGGTMPVYRDSTRGPLNEIDSRGRVVPIKK